MNAEQVGGLIRHIATALGGLLVGQGIVDQETMLTAVGAIATLGGLAWSFWVKRAQ